MTPYDSINIAILTLTAIGLYGLVLFFYRCWKLIKRFDEADRRLWDSPWFQNQLAISEKKKREEE